MTKNAFQKKKRLPVLHVVAMCIIFDRYKYFAIQFYGECWSGPDAEKTYARDGFSAEGCWFGLGKPSHNAVFRLQEMPGIYILCFNFFIGLDFLKLVKFFQTS